jgi:predicted DNA-binding transcriptional regulator YafY
MELTGEVRELIDLVERAIKDRAILSFDYSDQHGARTDRRVQPLGLWFWGKVWTLAAWCETREDFRMFRLDRTVGLVATGERFGLVAARSLAECLRRYEQDHGSQR